MKKFLLCFSIFLLVFCCGMIFVGMQNSNRNRKSKTSQLPDKKSLPGAAAGSCKIKNLPPLSLPAGANTESGSEKSWEYSGDIRSNLVSARGRLVSSFCHQGWVPAKKISLDASLAPREILTFTKQNHELILMLWKISGNMTGFAYRRELQEESIKQVIQ
jgi:hypothetical protein